MERLMVAIIGAALLPFDAAGAETISFDDQGVGKVPAGFSVALTGGGGPPKWEVQKVPEADGRNVAVETSADTTDYRFPLLVYDKIVAADLDVSVTFQATGGAVDQAAGIVWRYRDADNYYVVRANALEGNVVLYKVENGRRTDLPVTGKGRTYGAKAPVPKKAWNTLAVSVRGDTFTVSLNGAMLYEVEDRTFQSAGKAGLWTKADSLTMFRDLTIAVVK
jgi:hypothetical protein